LFFDPSFEAVSLGAFLHFWQIACPGHHLGRNLEVETCPPKTLFRKGRIMSKVFFTMFRPEVVSLCLLFGAWSVPAQANPQYWANSQNWMWAARQSEQCGQPIQALYQIGRALDQLHALPPQLASTTAADAVQLTKLIMDKAAYIHRSDIYNEARRLNANAIDRQIAMQAAAWRPSFPGGGAHASPGGAYVLSREEILELGDPVPPPSLGHDYSRPDRSRAANTTGGGSHVQPVTPLTPENVMYDPFERFQQKHDREAYLASRTQSGQGPECVSAGRPDPTGYAARQPGRGGEY
jgi:hypothetical protein